MYFSDEIALITVVYRLDMMKNQVIDKIKEQSVYADIKNVTQNEFFAGAQAGMKDQMRVDVRLADYHGEKTARLNMKLYDIYRTFQGEPDVIELYLKEAGNGKKVFNRADG